MSTKVHSWNPYSAENTERVRKDREQAKAEEAADDARLKDLVGRTSFNCKDRKQRLAALRGEEISLEVLEKGDEAELSGKTKLISRRRKDELANEEEEAQLHVKRLEEALTSKRITNKDGQLNFWADLEERQEKQEKQEKDKV